MQSKTTKKLIVDYNKLRSLFRFNCPENLIIQALKLEPIEPTGDELIDDILESLVDYKEFDNWGGSRPCAGRKPKNQDEKINLKIKMNKSSCVNQDVDKDKDKDSIIKNNIINIYTRFNAGFQNWKFEPNLLAVAKKYWIADTIRKIEIDFSCQEYNTETSIQELLDRYPADKSIGFKKPTIDEVRAYCRERMNMVDADKWYDYYTSNGWKVGKNPMKNWKAAVRTWEKSGYNNAKPQMPRMSLKEMQELQKEIEIQKILNGER